jgi:multidrug resistance efflux pump
MTTPIPELREALLCLEFSDTRGIADVDVARRALSAALDELERLREANAELKGLLSAARAQVSSFKAANTRLSRAALSNKPGGT